MISPIDTHLLIASTNRAAFPPAPGADLAELALQLQPKNISRMLDDGVMTGAVLIQRGKTYGFDNTLICATAAADHRLRAICAVDGRREDCGEIAGELLDQRGVVGLRMMEPEKGANLDWLSGPGALAAWGEVADRNALMDIHVFPWNRAAALCSLEALIGEFPDVRIILDNVGNVSVEEGAPSYGVDAPLTKIAEREGVSLKLSAMTFSRLRKAGHEPSEALAAFVSRFGAERLCWGSDVLAPKTNLTDAVEDARAASGCLSAKAAELFTSGTARRLFNFSDLSHPSGSAVSGI